MLPWHGLRTLSCCAEEIEPLHTCAAHASRAAAGRPTPCRPRALLADGGVAAAALLPPAATLSLVTRLHRAVLTDGCPLPHGIISLSDFHGACRDVSVSRLLRAKLRRVDDRRMHPGAALRRRRGFRAWPACQKPHYVLLSDDDTWIHPLASSRTYALLRDADRVMYGMVFLTPAGTARRPASLATGLQCGLAAIGALLAPAAAPPPRRRAIPVFLRLFLALSFGLVQRCLRHRNGGAGAGARVEAAAARAAAGQTRAAVRPVCDGSIGWLLTHGSLALPAVALVDVTHEPRAVVEEPLPRRARPRTLAMHRAFEWEEHFRFAPAPRRAPRPDAPGGRKRDGAQVPRRPRRGGGLRRDGLPRPCAASRAAPATRLRRLLQPGLRAGASAPRRAAGGRRAPS